MKRRERCVKQYVVGGSLCLLLVPGMLTLACSRDLAFSGQQQPKSGDANPEVTGTSAISSDCEGKTESFPIEASYRGLLDIVVAIDSANASTQQSRAQAAERMRPLIEKLGDSDYQIAIISGDLNACVEKVITKNTPNAVDALVNAIKTGPTGAGEYINMKAITALTGVVQATRNKQDHTVTDQGHCSNEHSDWLRDDSVVAIIIISGNKHLCCEPLACTMIDIEKSLQDINRLSNNSSGRRLYRLYGLLNQGTPYNKDRRQPDHTLGGNWYVDWSDFETYNIGGGYEQSSNSNYLADFVKSIDDHNYGKIFDDITNDLAASLGDTFTLAETHDDKCAEVFLTTAGKANKLPASEYEISGNTLKIKKVLTSKDTQVGIVYSHAQ